MRPIHLYALGASYLCAALLTVAGTLISVSISERNARETDAESNRKWCVLLVSIDDVYQETPPTTATGRNFAAGIHQLRTDFSCT